MRADRLRTPVLRVLRVGLVAGLLALLWHVAGGAAAVALLSSADPGWLAAAFAALSLQTVLSALRWRLTAAQLGIRFDRDTALREYYLSQIVNQALPGGVLGDAGRAVRAREQAGLMASGQAVVFERLAGQVALFVLLAVAVLATLAMPGGFGRSLLPLGRAASVVACVLAVVAVVCVAMYRRGGRQGTWLARVGGDLSRALWAPAVRWRQVGLSLGTALCNVAAFVFCTQAVGAGLPVAAALVLVPLILFAMVIPLTVSGWGLREGAAAAIFPLAGATAAQGLAASVAFGLVFLAVALPGLAFIGRAPAAGSLQSR